MNTDNSNNPKYYRLLEKGEIIKEGDVWLDSGESVSYASVGSIYQDFRKAGRPVICDEWQLYSEKKPTKEDFEPTGTVQVIRNNGDPIHVSPSWLERKELRPSRDVYNVGFWRRVIPPQQPKTSKIVILEDKKTGGRREVTAHADGHVSIGCGDNYSAESIEEFIRVREEVTGKKKKELAF